jgi:hypothetical protein
LIGMSFLSFLLSPILVAILAICREWTWKLMSLWGAKWKQKPFKKKLIPPFVLCVTWVSCIVKMINVLILLLMELKMRLLGARILLKGEMVTPLGHF